MHRSNSIHGRFVQAWRAVGKALPGAILAAAVAAGPASAIRPESPAVGRVQSEPGPKRPELKNLRKLEVGDLGDAARSQGQGGRQARVALQGDAAAQVMQRLNAKLRPAGGEVVVRAVQVDPKGNRHIRLQQLQGGYPIIGAEAVVHVDRNNEVYAAGGRLAEGLSVGRTPGLNAQDAGSRVRAALKLKSDARERLAPRLVIFNGALAYETEIEEAGTPPHVWRAYVDAATGELLHREDRILHSAPVGGAPHDVTGARLTGEDGTTVTINGWRDDRNLFFLRNNTALWGVYDQDLFDWSQNATGDWGTTDRAAVSLARNIELTQRYVAEVLSRNSYDDAGAFANTYVHEGTNYVNAYWDGQGLHFGDGDGLDAGPLTTLDIAAHEFGHAITEYTSGLVYSYESGALNESYSDIMGALVEFWGQPDGRSAYPAGLDGRADWMMGEDCWLSSEALRDLRSPTRFGQPSYYHGTFWYTGSGDNGGVHTNSGVQNFAFYLLAEGGTGSNDGHPYSITGLGISAAGEIATYANMYLLTGGAQYQDAREAWILAAATLGYNAQTVRDVWTACGVLEQVNHLSASPAALAFGDAGLGSAAVLNLALSNDGANPTTVTGMAFDNPAFTSTTVLPLTVAGGATVTVPVRFTPTALGPVSGGLLITSNADDNPSLNVGLSGTGVEPASISVSPASFSLALAAGGSATRDFTIANNGSGDALDWNLQGVSRTPAAGPSAEAGPTTIDILSWTRFTDMTGEYANVVAAIDAYANPHTFDTTITLDPAALEAKLADMDLFMMPERELGGIPAGTGAAFRSVLQAFLDRGGVVVVHLPNTSDAWSFMDGAGLMRLGAGTTAISGACVINDPSHPLMAGVAAPLNMLNLTAAQSVLDDTHVIASYSGYMVAGERRVGRGRVIVLGPDFFEYTANWAHVLSNAVNLAPQAASSWVTASEISGTVPAGESRTITLRFDAANLLGGSYSLEMLLSHNAPATSNPLHVPVGLTVDGYRRLAVSPLALDFGDVQVGSRRTDTLVLSNAGDEPTQVASITTGLPEFQVTATLPMIVPAFGSLKVPVAFAPVDVGPESADLTIVSDAEDNPSLEIPLAGAGTPPPRLAFSPGSFSKVLMPGQTDSDILTISNTGGASLNWSLAFVPDASPAVAGAVKTRHLANLLRQSVPVLPDWMTGSNGAVPGSSGKDSPSAGQPFPAVFSGIWNNLAPMAAARSQHGLAAPGNGKLYAFGGWAGSSLYATTEVYDIATGTWTAGPAMPAADRGITTAVGLDGNVYVLGGTLSRAYRFVPSTGTWTTLPSPPVTSTWEASAVAGDDGRIYLFSGESSAINAVQIYDPATNAWTAGAPMPTPRRQAGAAKLPGGLILVAGGTLSSSSATAAVEIYDPVANTWSSVAPMPVAKNQFGMAAGRDGRIYAIGGKQSYTNNTGPFLTDVAAYNPATGVWSQEDSLPGPLGELEAVEAGGRIYFAGGTDGSYQPVLGALDVQLLVSASPASGTVAPGGATQVTVGFDGRNLPAGLYSGSLEITHNDPLSPSPAALPVQVEIEGVRLLSVTPASLDFGSLWAGTQAVRTLVLENAGNEPTNVASISTGSPDLSVAATLPLTVPAFGSVTVDVAFSSGVVGAASGIMTLASDAADSPTLEIGWSGTVTEAPSAAVSPSSFALSLAPTDAPADRTATLSNTGGDILHWRIASVAQSNLPVPTPTLARPLPRLREDLIYAESNYGHAYVPGRVIVGFKPGQGDFAASQPVAALGIRGLRELARAVNPRTGLKANAGRKVVLLEIQDPDGVRHAIDVLRRDANVAYAEPDYVQKAIALPNDASFAQLYGMHNTGQTGGTADADIDAPEAWDRHSGNRGILIGVIDTGIDYLHPDLAANIWTNPGEVAGNGIDDDGNGFIDDVHGWDFAYDDNNPTDGHYHGTHVSGTIAGIGNNGVGVAGVMWTASLVALKFLDDSGGGSTSDAVDAVNYATAMDIAITSNSWGGGGFSQALEDAIAAGGLFIAAAGNSGSDNDLSPHYPSSYDLDNIIAVAATDHNDAMASFSCYGLTSVDLGAPGVNTYSTAPGNSYQTLSGTSMATPHVSGAAGLIWTFNPTLTAAQVKAALLASVDPVPALAGRTVTGGRLNVAKALDGAGPTWLTASTTASGILAPGATAPITVTVNPAGLVAGRWTGEVTLATDDPAHPELPILVTADVSGCRSLEVDPAAHDFGNVFAGASARTEIMLRNVCNDTVTVASVSADNPAFGLDAAFPLDVPPFAAVPIQAVFQPAAAGTFAGVLTLATNADTDPAKTLSLAGAGVEPPVATVNPAQITRTLVPGASTLVDLDIGNSGGSDLTWTLSNVSRGFVAPAAYGPEHFAELAKGAPDSRIGRPVAEASGGPDAFGYTWTDSDQPGGPAYQWQDIQSTGTVLIASCDDCYATAPLSFPFPFYGNTFNQVNVVSNGYVNFGIAAGQYTNYPLPSTSMPANLAAAFFDDLSGGPIYFQDFGNRAVIQWQNVGYYTGTGTVTFQIVLHADGEIDFYYANMTGSVLSSTTGIQDGTRTVGLQVQYNAPYIKNQLAVRFRSLPDWLRVSETAGTVPAGGTQRLALTLDAASLAAGSYSQTMTLSHNNPALPDIGIPVTLIVSDVPGGSRILRVGPSAQAAASGSRYYMWNLTVGGQTRGLMQGGRYLLYLK